MLLFYVYSVYIFISTKEECLTAVFFVFIDLNLSIYKIGMVNDEI